MHPTPLANLAYLLALGSNLVLDDIFQHHVYVHIKASAGYRCMGMGYDGWDKGCSSNSSPSHSHLSVPTISLSPRSRIQILLPMHRSTSSEGSKWLGLPPRLDRFGANIGNKSTRVSASYAVVGCFIFQR